MSRIGRMPVNVPADVSVNINGQELHVKGPKGELTREFLSTVSLLATGAGSGTSDVGCLGT